MTLRKFLNPELFNQITNIVETGVPFNEEIDYSLDPAARYKVTMVKLGDGFTVTLSEMA